MDTLLFLRPARTATLKPTLVGYVGSGDLEVMIDHTDGQQAEIHVRTSSTGSEARWQQLIEHIEADRALPAMRMDIHDFAATPGVIRLRIEQALELALENGEKNHD